VERLNIEASSQHEFAETVTTAERSRRLVAAIQREARFRDDVLSAYEHSCSLSGLSVGASPSRAYGLLDAAHIRPVGSQGSDTIANGLALTPTLHRMFDKGLFTLVYRGSSLQVRTSPRLTEGMVRGREGFSLQLVDGLEPSAPTDSYARPSREALDYHRSQIFIAR
jgi:putative restriction endonuclease